MTYGISLANHFDTPSPGAVQVRGARNSYFGLTFNPARKECPSCPFILAFVPDLDDGVVRLRGWAIGEQIMAEGVLIEKTGSPFYRLSPDRLFALPEKPHPYFYLEDTICRHSAP